MKIIDKTILDLLSLGFTGLGIMSILIRFHTPKLSQAYIGSNPHHIKKEIVDSTTNWVFVFFACIGLTIQGISIVLADSLPRLYEETWYGSFSISIIFVLFALLKMTLFLSHKFTERFWKRELGKLYSKRLPFLHFMLSLENEFANQYKKDKGLIGKDEKVCESMRSANMDNAINFIEDLEELFEIKNIDSNLNSRLDKITPYLLPHYLNLSDKL